MTFRIIHKRCIRRRFLFFENRNSLRPASVSRRTTTVYIPIIAAAVFGKPERIPPLRA